VDWEKIGTSHARPLSEMLEFFKKAKEYAPSIESLITPLAAFDFCAWFFNALPGAAADSSAPSTATEPAAEVS
jgi:hypothetical protein